MANKVKLGFIIVALTFFLFPFKVSAIIGDPLPLSPTLTPTDTPTPTPTSTPTPEPTATPTIMEEGTEENEGVISNEGKSTAISIEKGGSPTNIWQMATFGLVIAFLAIIIGFILGGKRDQKEKPKSESQKEEENENEETEE